MPFSPNRLPPAQPEKKSVTPGVPPATEELQPFTFITRTEVSLPSSATNVLTRRDGLPLVYSFGHLGIKATPPIPNPKRPFIQEAYSHDWYYDPKEAARQRERMMQTALTQKELRSQSTTEAEKLAISRQRIEEGITEIARKWEVSNEQARKAFCDEIGIDAGILKSVPLPRIKDNRTTRIAKDEDVYDGLTREQVKSLGDTSYEQKKSWLEGFKEAEKEGGLVWHDE